MLEAVKNVSRSVEAFLKDSRPVEADEENLTLGFKYPFHKDSVDNPKNRALVEESFGKVLAHPVRVRCTLIPRDSPSPAAPVVLKDGAARPSADTTVKLAEELFGGKVVKVEQTGE